MQGSNGYCFQNMRLLRGLAACPAPIPEHLGPVDHHWPDIQDSPISSWTAPPGDGCPGIASRVIETHTPLAFHGLAILQEEDHPAPHHVLDPLVGLSLRVDEERPAAGELHDDAVFDG